MVYQTRQTPIAVPRNSVIVDFWIGDSLMLGEQALEANLQETLPTSVVTSKVWSKITDKANRLNASGTHSFIAAPDSYEAQSSSNQIVYPAYGSALEYSEGQLGLNVHPDAVEDYHHFITLGISSSAANDDTATVATKAAHWSPLVTGAGTGTDFGALQLYKQEYVTPAMQALQTRGVTPLAGALYVTLNNDANNAYSQAVADSFPMHMLQIIRDFEKFLGIAGMPVVSLGPPYVDATSAYTRLDGLVAQLEALQALRPRTMFLNCRKYDTAADKIHYSSQATIDIGREATQLRYRSNAGLLPITKTF